MPRTVCLVDVDQQPSIAALQPYIGSGARPPRKVDHQHAYRRVPSPWPDGVQGIDHRGMASNGDADIVRGMDETRLTGGTPDL